MSNNWKTFSTFLVTFLVNFTLFNLNSWELKLFSGCSLKICINESQATNRNVLKLTSLHPGLSISSWLLAWSGWPALTGFNITLSPMTTYRRGHCMFQSIQKNLDSQKCRHLSTKAVFYQPCLQKISACKMEQHKTKIPSKKIKGCCMRIVIV